jgi:uncharacterized protein (DUF1330 family)
MTRIRTFTLIATLAMAGLGTIAARNLHAQGQASAPAYVVTEITVTDPAGFAAYAKREGSLIEKFGGRFLARGGKAISVSGAVPQRMAIYVFDSMAKAQAWRDAPEQAELTELRDKSSMFFSVIVEGCATCAPPQG